MTQSTSDKHQEPQDVQTGDCHRGTDGARAVGIDPPPQDPGNSRGGHHHDNHKPEHPGKDS